MQTLFMRVDTLRRVYQQPLSCSQSKTYKDGCCPGALNIDNSCSEAERCPTDWYADYQTTCYPLAE
jgi:hypothetical protein